MTESQVAAPTDSTSVLTANPVVTSTFDDKVVGSCESTKQN